MKLVQIFLPLNDNEGNRFASELFQKVKEELMEEFGGGTAFMQSPAEGFWEKSREDVQKDDVVTLEVMTEELNRSWWSRYKKQLEKTFAQEEILIRSSSIEVL